MMREGVTGISQLRSSYPGGMNAALRIAAAGMQSSGASQEGAPGQNFDKDPTRARSVVSPSWVQASSPPLFRFPPFVDMLDAYRNNNWEAPSDVAAAPTLVPEEQYSSLIVEHSGFGNANSSSGGSGMVVNTGMGMGQGLVATATPSFATSAASPPVQWYQPQPVSNAPAIAALAQWQYTPSPITETQSFAPNCCHGPAPANSFNTLQGGQQDRITMDQLAAFELPPYMTPIHYPVNPVASHTQQIAQPTAQPAEQQSIPSSFSHVWYQRPVRSPLTPKKDTENEGESSRQLTPRAQLGTPIPDGAAEAVPSLKPASPEESRANRRGRSKSFRTKGPRPQPGEQQQQQQQGQQGQQAAPKPATTPRPKSARIACAKGDQAKKTADQQVSVAELPAAPSPDQRPLGSRIVARHSARLAGKLGEQGDPPSPEPIPQKRTGPSG